MNDTREWTLQISPSGTTQVALVADLSDDLQYVRVIPKAEAERIERQGEQSYVELETKWREAERRVQELEEERNRWAHHAERAEVRVQELEGLVREMLSDDQDGYRLRPDLEKRALTALARKPNRKED